jgi:hypothetical protein
VVVIVEYRVRTRVAAGQRPSLTAEAGHFRSFVIYVKIVVNRRFAQQSQARKENETAFCLSAAYHSLEGRGGGIESRIT